MCPTWRTTRIKTTNYFCSWWDVQALCCLMFYINVPMRSMYWSTTDVGRAWKSRAKRESEALPFCTQRKPSPWLKQIPFAAADKTSCTSHFPTVNRGSVNIAAMLRFLTAFKQVVTPSLCRTRRGLNRCQTLQANKRSRSSVRRSHWDISISCVCFFFSQFVDSFPCFI